MENQLYIFTIFIFCGLILGILFDIFRILRKSFKTIDLITYIEDFIFWLLTGILLLYCIFKFNNGEIRLYIFIGIIVGFLFYIILFSKIFTKISIYIINFIKKIIYYIIIVPIKFIFNILKKIIFRPISFVFININKTLSNIKLKFKNIKLKKEKSVAKKDLT